MTDQTAPDVTNNERRLAREWAGFINSNTILANLEMRAAARVILNAVPTPPRPTLADMAPEERAACQWMQAGVEDSITRCVIVNPFWEDGSARVLWPGGFMEEIDWGQVTPRPDLPRLEWPVDTPTGPDHLAVGTVIESAADPRIAALPDGSVLLDREGEATAKRNHSWRGAGYTPVPSQGVEFGPWTVLHIPKEEI